MWVRNNRDECDLSPLESAARVVTDPASDADWRVFVRLDVDRKKNDYEYTNGMLGSFLRNSLAKL